MEDINPFEVANVTRTARHIYIVYDDGSYAKLDQCLICSCSSGDGGRTYGISYELVGMCPEELVPLASSIMELGARFIPNEPLTLDELREMDGEPVWVIWRNRAEWAIIHSCQPPEVFGRAFVMVTRSAAKYQFEVSDCGKTWLAYRRKPEEGV